MEDWIQNLLKFALEGKEWDSLRREISDLRVNEKYNIGKFLRVVFKPEIPFNPLQNRLEIVDCSVDLEDVKFPLSSVCTCGMECRLF